jgi:hypothetical protein
MATNIDVTLKRYNGTDYDLILPTTHLGQLYTDNTLATPLATFLTNTYIPLSQRGAANGVATLDANGKLLYSEIPDSILGGLKFTGLVSSGFNPVIALDNINQEVGIGNLEVFVGRYLVTTENFTFEPSEQAVQRDSTGRYYAWKLAPYIEEGNEDFEPTSVTLEIGDWLIIVGMTGTGTEQDPYTAVYGIVNNTYANASDSEKGVVKLSSATDTTGTTSKVITESILGGLIGTAANTIAAGDHLHDDRYYTETEIGHYFDGTTAITGYNKANWDTAYGWGDHSVEGYLTEESLADLTDTTLTSLAANDILRYNGTAWVNDGNFKPILYGTGQTSSITGAIIIETD